MLKSASLTRSITGRVRALPGTGFSFMPRAAPAITRRDMVWSTGEGAALLAVDLRALENLVWRLCRLAADIVDALFQHPCQHHIAIVKSGFEVVGAVLSFGMRSHLHRR